LEEEMTGLRDHTGGGWQSIETAPKDGQEIIVAYGHQNFVKDIVRFDRLRGFWVSKGEPRLGLQNNATHWIAIPPIGKAAPTTLKAEGGEK
jgi:hypothetical protein